MRKRRDSGSRFGAVAFTGVVLLCIALGLTGCEEESDPNGENKIIAFKIDGIYGSIAEIDQQISITVPESTVLTALKPVVTISADASVSPASEEVVDITYPVSYTVTAENGVTRTYTVTVNTPAPDVVLSGIKVQSLPIQTIYQTGESFSPAGLVIVGFYSDKTVREEIGYTLSPLPVNLTTEGEQKITVTVGEKSTDFTVSARRASLESISVAPLKTSYAYNYDTNFLFDNEDIVVIGHYSDGSTKTEDVESYTVSDYDFTKAGTQTLVVTMNNKTATFTVSVHQVVLESISVAPLKTTYAYVDEASSSFNNADIVVTGRYSDGSTKTVPADSYEVTGYDFTKPGTQTLLVTTEDGKTATFTISVQRVILESIWVEALKTSYAYDEAFNSANIIVTGRYSDGATKTETVEASDVTGYNPQKAGYQTLVVTKDGKTATFGVTVGAKREISVSIGLPNDSDRQPEIFGLPAEGIKLSMSQNNNNLPSRIVISAAGSAWDNVSWYIDGNYVSSRNILEIFASDGYALKIPHSITFVGTRGGVEYSRIIPFTVDK